MSLFEAVSREAIYLGAIGRTLFRLRHVKPDSPHTVNEIFEDVAARKPRNTAVLFEERVLTYEDLSQGANRYAHWALAQGLRKGDVVALFMESRPEYLMAWLGLVKLGAVVALINTNLRGAALAHCITIAEAKLAVVGSELAAAYVEAMADAGTKPAPWITGGPVHGGEDLDAALAEASSMPVDIAVRQGLVAKDNAFYIYTSGTTGLPKAARFSHMRMLYMMYGFAGALDTRESDRIYDTLPLYHSTGGVCAVGMALTVGGALVIRRKFSVHAFWQDCRRYDITVFQYIGELCRYLLNAPPGPHERDHRIRAITGNGLRPEIWDAFQKRFAIPRIVEFYGATEGNVSMLNYDGKPGAVGRIPWYMRGLIKTRIVRFDVESEMPVRGADGFCIECADGETGEALGAVDDEAGRRFEGYTHSADSEKKLLRDVFEKGDVWYRTGDLMRRDAHGYFTFVDRIGDTFRWKGENVSTGEVAGVLESVPEIAEANVYGVGVPGQDGRAGMAALVVAPGFDAQSLGAALAGKLPAYARPLFLRLRPEMEITGTFKQRKVDLVRDGFDPAHVADPLYWFDAQNGRYQSLDAARYRDIVEGRVKL
ncbi:MAG: long-chain-acyl-CoA synthetase [Alphaproteobacteria bacterium]|nr:long-chain-acyl-CoA synthetase [Alphaproteobacteria bacterium]